MKYIHDYGERFVVRVRLLSGDIVKSFKYRNKKQQAKAKKDAVDFRNSTLEEHGVLYFLDHLNKPTTRNFSDAYQSVVGVIHTQSQDTLSWTASWTNFGVCTRKSFSIKKYGNIDAFKQACAERYKAKGMLLLKNKKNLPCPLEVPFRIFDESVHA